MARGARKTFDDRIADIDRKIAELTEEKKDLLNQKEQARKDGLLKIIDKSGLTADELLELIEKNKKAK